MSRQERAREELRRLAYALDSRFKTPFGRIGWDGILGLIPGVGDVVTGLLALYILVRAAGLGASPIVLLRMGGNILFENVIDTIPLFGNFFDFFWKANSRNMALLDQHLENPHRARRNSYWLVALVLLMIVGAVVAIVATGIYILRWALMQWQAPSF